MFTGECQHISFQLFCFYFLSFLSVFYNPVQFVDNATIRTVPKFILTKETPLKKKKKIFGLKKVPSNENYQRNSSVPFLEYVTSLPFNKTNS